MSNTRAFLDRQEAGRLLGEALAAHPLIAGMKDLLVLAVPRGGVPVGAEVAKRLEAPLDLVIAHKIGAPRQPELAIGAVVVPGDQCILDEEAVRNLGVTEAYLRAETAAQLAEANRRTRMFREDARPPDLAGKTVIVVDDGIATGYTLSAALLAVRNRHPAAVVVAVPVAPRGVVQDFAGKADAIVCLATPEPFYAVGGWYRNFDQVSDEQVWHLLRPLREAETANADA